MVSARRAARAGIGVSCSDENDPPEWFWDFDGRLWGWHSKDLSEAFREGRPINGRHEASKKWRAARVEWLEARDMVCRDVGGLSWQEFQRIEREEPHRVLRRP